MDSLIVFIVIFVALGAAIALVRYLNPPGGDPTAIGGA